jgi:hypothetical protein
MASFIFNAPGLPKSRAELEALRKRRDGARPSGRAPANVGEGLSFLGQAIASRILDGKVTAGEQAAAARNSELQRSLLEGFGGGTDPYAAPASPSSAAPAAPRTANSVGGPDERAPQTDLVAGIKETAQALGIDPLDLGTAISYETAGTLDPLQMGPRTKWGQHRGLIQFGEPQAQKYGVDWKDPIGSQLGANGAVANYLRDAGVKPGMGLLDVYSAINAGGVGKYGARDAAAGGAPGTVRDKVEQQMAGHREKAMALLGAQPAASAFAPTPPAGGALDAVNTMAARGGLPSDSDPSLRFDYSKPAATAASALAAQPPLPTLPQPAPIAPPMPTARPNGAAPATPATPPSPAPMAGINPAGMSYDPATGRVGAGVSLNPGAKAMPNARAAFLGAGAPAGSNPVRSLIENTLGVGESGAPTSTAAPAPQTPAAPAMQGGVMERVIAAITDPNASEETRALGMSLLQREMAKNAPGDPFTLGEGQVRYDGRGRKIAEGPAKAADTLKPTDDMREYNFYVEQTKAAGGQPVSFDAYMKGMKEAGRSNNSVTFAGDNAFQKKVGEKQAEMYIGLTTDGLQAQSDLAKITELRQRLASSPGGLLTGLQQYASSLGIPLGENVSDIQAAQAIINQLVPQQRPAGAGTMSDRDVELFKQSLPSLMNTPAGNKMILDTMEAMAQYRQRQGDIANAVIAGSLTPEQGARELRALPNPIDNFRANAGLGRTAPPTTSPGTPDADGWTTLPNGAKIREVK